MSSHGISYPLFLVFQMKTKQLQYLPPLNFLNTIDYCAHFLTIQLGVFDKSQIRDDVGMWLLTAVCKRWCRCWPVMPLW